MMRIKNNYIVNIGMQIICMVEQCRKAASNGFE